MRHGKFTKTVTGLGCALAASGSLSAASFVLNGTKMTVGVDESGGLIDSSFMAGIIPAWRPGVDYLRPHIPFQFYSIGVNGQWAAAGYYHGNTFSATTANTSAGSILSATTTGTFGALSFTQYLWFGLNDTTIHYQITFENTGNYPLNAVVYAVGLDPDQEYYPLGIADTLNSILPHGDTVIATGANLGDWIQIFGIAPQDPYFKSALVASVSKDWYTDPYILIKGPYDGNGDYTINMAFSFGKLDPGEQKIFGYEISIGTKVIPEPQDYALLGGLGLLGFAAYRRYRK
jgi:hypothetical protein